MSPVITRDLLKRAGQAVANRVRAPKYAARTMAVDEVPEGSVIVYFAAVPEELYQLEQWQVPLEKLAERRPVVVLVTRPDIGTMVEQRLPFPVVFAPRGVQLERLASTGRAAVMLYVNHREPNFRMLRYGEVAHVYLGHGESDKGASASHQNMAYDYAPVAGRAGQERLAAALPLFDAATRAPIIGRPNRDVEAAATAFGGPVEGRLTVLYAPTWEGALPSMAFGTVESHGRALVSALLADNGIRVIYRPHPLTGSISRAHGAADAQVRQLIGAAGGPHVVDTGTYGPALDAADVGIVDISSVAYDWLATGKPMIVTQPVDERARPTSSELLEVAPRLSADRAAAAASMVHELSERTDPRWAALVERHFGDTSPGASTGAFLAMIDRAVALRDRQREQLADD